MINMFMAYTVVMISQRYTYLQTHQVEHIKYLHLFVCLNKIFKKEKDKVVFK